MIRFNNDYNRSAHPAVLEALMKSSGESYGGYGLDFWCEKAAEEIGKYIGTGEADIHFLVGGTQANFTVITAALRSYQSVISADTGHIQGHETGAVENTGHKIIALPSADGKITAAQVREQAELYLDSGIKEHITQPKMVYLSFPTEFGTVYSKAELEEISGVCRRYGLFLFIDGARLGYGLGAAEADVTMEDIARLADVFYCGGTKCGALFGEAVVIINPVLKTDFRSYIKQNGGMLAKGWLLGIQFYTLFRDGLYFKITQEADRQAMRIRQAFRQKGIPFCRESDESAVCRGEEQCRGKTGGKIYLRIRAKNRRRSLLYPFLHQLEHAGRGCGSSDTGHRRSLKQLRFFAAYGFSQMGNTGNIEGNKSGLMIIRWNSTEKRNLIFENDILL